MTSTWLRAKVSERLPFRALDEALPRCGNRHCPRPATVWQRWWARNEGVALEQDWYCSPECFATGVAVALRSATEWGRGRRATRNRVPLGLILFSQGLISQQQLRRALARQAESRRGRIGDWLLADAAVSEAQIAAALAAQQGVAVFQCGVPEIRATMTGLPAALFRNFGCVPVFYRPESQRMLVGFTQEVDRGFLHAMEHIFECKVEPGMVRESVFFEALSDAPRAYGSEVVVFEQPRNAPEITNAVTCYAQQVGAETCKLANTGSSTWFRLCAEPGSCFDLLFRTIS